MKNRPQGFTLMEILIALFIFTILSMILASALNSVLRASSDTERKAERLRNLQMNLLIFSRDLEQTVDRATLNEAGKYQPAFMGEDNSFYFTHTGFYSEDKSIMQRVHYFADKNGLVKETWPALDLAPKTESNKRTLLAADEIKFEYLDTDGRFHSKWPFDRQGQQSLPRAVRIHLKFNDWGEMTQLFRIFGESSSNAPTKS